MTRTLTQAPACVIVTLPTIMDHQDQDKVATTGLVQAQSTRQGSGLNLTALSGREDTQQIGEKLGLVARLALAADQSPPDHSEYGCKQQCLSCSLPWG